MVQDTLAKRISEKKGLTEEEQLWLVCVFGKHCQGRTKAQLAAVARWIPDIPNRGIYERVLFGEYGQAVSYCAGQSYPDEIRTVRELLIGRA